MNTPILIVGSGPSGMTMALALSQFGIATCLIDRRESISTSPRAHALNCRTLETFAALGIDIKALRNVATPDHESGWVRWVDTLSGGEYGAVPYERLNAPESMCSPQRKSRNPSMRSGASWAKVGMENARAIRAINTCFIG